MIRREASRLIMEMAERRSLLTIAGPRYAGKSALARYLMPDHTYIDLETPSIAKFARSRPAEFFKRYGGDIIIDEFRHAPELFGHLKDAAANRRIVLITSRKLSRGRAALSAAAETVTLLPLSISELNANGIGLGRDEYIHRGFIPSAYLRNAAPREAQQNYIAALLRQDIAPLISVENRLAFKRFLKLLAERVGQALNLGTFAKTVGVPSAVLAKWILMLEAHFVVFRLPVFPISHGETTAISAQKFYFTDVGLAAHLLKIPAPDQVPRHPAVGNLFENLVAAEALKASCNSGHNVNLFYYRSRDGFEVDLILQRDAAVVPVEIKSTATFNAAFADNIKRFRAFSPNIKDGYVVYSGAGKKRKKRNKRRNSAMGAKFVGFGDVGKIVRGMGI
jgi:predicted AAA+ superfamily ATPase